MKPRKPIARVSARMKERLKEYAKVKRKFLRDNPTCMAPDCERKATDLHHSRGRAAALLTDVRFFKALCRYHHLQVHESPRWAMATGLTCMSGQWGKQTP